MKCPKCSYWTDPSALECPACGLVFSKWLARQTASTASPVPEQPLGPPPGLPPIAKISIGTGFVLIALLLALGVFRLSAPPPRASATRVPPVETIDPSAVATEIFGSAKRIHIRTFEGFTLDALSQQPVANVELCFRGIRLQKVVSDAGGHYTISVEAVGGERLVVGPDSRAYSTEWIGHIPSQPLGLRYFSRLNVSSAVLGSDDRTTRFDFLLVRRLRDAYLDPLVERLDADELKECKLWAFHGKVWDLRDKSPIAGQVIEFNYSAPTGFESTPVKVKTDPAGNYHLSLRVPPSVPRVQFGPENPDYMYMFAQWRTGDFQGASPTDRCGLCSRKPDFGSQVLTGINGQTVEADLYFCPYFRETPFDSPEYCDKFK